MQTAPPPTTTTPTKTTTTYTALGPDGFAAGKKTGFQVPLPRKPTLAPRTKRGKNISKI